MKIYLYTTLTGLEENKAIVRELESLGHESKLVDLSDLKFRVEDNSLTWGFEEIPDIVIFRGIFLSTKLISSFIIYLRSKGIKVFDNNFSEHKYAIDKLYDVVLLAKNNLPLPKSFYGRSEESFAAAKETLGFPLIIKGTRSGKGVGVYKIDSEERLNEFESEIKSEERQAKEFLFQEFIDYEYDLRVFVLGDEVFAMRRIPKDGEFRANFSLGGSVENYEEDEELKNLAIKAARAVNLDVAGVDVLIDRQGKRYILEVNHTPGMIGIERAKDKNITKLYVEYAISHAK